MQEKNKKKKEGCGLAYLIKEKDRLLVLNFLVQAMWYCNMTVCFLFASCSLARMCCLAIALGRPKTKCWRTIVRVCCSFIMFDVNARRHLHTMLRWGGLQTKFSCAQISFQWSVPQTVSSPQVLTIPANRLVTPTERNLSYSWKNNKTTTTTTTNKQTKTTTAATKATTQRQCLNTMCFRLLVQSRW